MHACFKWTSGKESLSPTFQCYLHLGASQPTGKASFLLRGSQLNQLNAFSLLAISRRRCLPRYGCSFSTRTVSASALVSGSRPSVGRGALLTLSHMLSPGPVWFNVSPRLIQLIPKSITPSHARYAFSTTRLTMVGTKIDGTAIAKNIRERLKEEIQTVQQSNPRFKPSLVIFQGQSEIRYGEEQWRRATKRADQMRDSR
jgi:hypothetical protein